MSPDPQTIAVRSWTGVEYRHLAAFAQVAETRSFRSAARALGYAQSAISQHVSQLERIVGLQLARRQPGTGEVTLTAAGDVLLRHARPILAVYHAAHADLDAIADGEPLRLRVAVADHAAQLIGGALAAFRQAHPGVELSLLRAVSPECAASALEVGELDVLLGDPPRAAASFELRTLAEVPYVLAAPVAWRVLRGSWASLDALLAHLPLACCESDPDVARVEGQLLARGVAVRWTATASGMSSLVALVAAGDAAALLPANVVPDHDARIATTPLGSLLAPRPMVAAWHRDRRTTAHAQALVDSVGRLGDAYGDPPMTDRPQAA